MPEKKQSAKEKVLELGLIHSEELIKAVEDRIPAHQQGRFLATVVVEERRRDAKPESVRNLAYWLEDYKGRKVEIPSISITGILNDAVHVQDNVVLLIDDVMRVLDPMVSAWVYPKTGDAIEDFDSGHWTPTREFIAPTTRYMSFNENANVAYHMPKLPPKKVYVTHTAYSVYRNRFNWAGHDIRIKDSVDNFGGILSDCSRPNKHTVVLVLDGKIINFATDAELDVEL